MMNAADRRRITGNATAPYVWRDDRRENRRPVSARSSKQKQREERRIKKILAFLTLISLLVAIMLVAFSEMALHSKKLQLSEAETRGIEIDEQIQSAEQVIQRETSLAIIGQRAQDQLGMVKPDSFVTVGANNR